MDEPIYGGLEPDVKGMREERCNPSFCTTAPNSVTMSFTTSPPLSPSTRCDRAHPSLGFDCMPDFMLPEQEKSSDEEMPDEPVSRVSSPMHKVPRLGDVVAAELAPVTPRAMPGSPRTPPSCTREVRRYFTPPPLVPKSKLSRPPLLQALQMKSLEQVRAALKANPEDANDPFWDHDSEPPLCCAVRLECSPSIVKLLLENGADSDVSDKRNRTPLQIVLQKSSSRTDNAAWSSANMYNATFLPALPEVVAEDLWDARTCVLWHREVADLLSGGN